MRYVRNAVARAITPDAPPIEGIVEEAWPSPEHMTDPMLFYCAGDDTELMKRNLSAMLESVMAIPRARHPAQLYDERVPVPDVAS